MRAFVRPSPYRPVFILIVLALALCVGFGFMSYHLISTSPTDTSLLNLPGLQSLKHLHPGRPLSILTRNLPPQGKGVGVGVDHPQSHDPNAPTEPPPLRTGVKDYDDHEHAELEALIKRWPAKWQLTTPPDTRDKMCRNRIHQGGHKVTTSDTEHAWERELHKQYRNTPHYESAHWDPRIWNYRVSIIIPTYSDINQTLFRTTVSILLRTPPALLDAIIYIDDHNPDFFVDPTFGGYGPALPKVIVHRNPARLGLIQAKIIGAEIAPPTSNVLLFLEGHCEVNFGWLEPLLERIAVDNKIVPIPVIDIISEDGDRPYTTTASIMRGIFDWDLRFSWELPPPYLTLNFTDPRTPIMSPTMSGGLFAIHRDWFNKWGTYDGKQEIWGYENIEMSYRIWQCGGRLEIIQCSRVGHVFRRTFPYAFPDQQRIEWVNRMRVIDVWMDEYRQHPITHYPNGDIRQVKYGDISDRLAIRRDLQCHPFDWYIQNVYPEAQYRMHHQYTMINTATNRPWTVAIITIARGISHSNLQEFYQNVQSWFLYHSEGNAPSLQWFLFTDNPIFDASLYAHIKWNNHRYNRIHIPSIPPNVYAYYVPAKDWPANHFSAINDLTSNLINATTHDFIYYIDPTMRFTTNITFQTVWGELIAMEHPYYRRTGPNFCTEVDHPEPVEGPPGWTFCTYPYMTNPDSTAYLNPHEYKKHPPFWTTATSWMYSTAMFGGRSSKVKKLLQELSANVAKDVAKNIFGPLAPIPYGYPPSICTPQQRFSHDHSEHLHLSGYDMNLISYFECEQSYLNHYLNTHAYEVRVLPAPHNYLHHSSSILMRYNAFEWLYETTNPTRVTGYVMLPHYYDEDDFPSTMHVPTSDGWHPIGDVEDPVTQILVLLTHPQSLTSQGEDGTVHVLDDATMSEAKAKVEQYMCPTYATYLTSHHKFRNSIYNNIHARRLKIRLQQGHDIPNRPQTKKQRRKSRQSDKETSVSEDVENLTPSPFDKKTYIGCHVTVDILSPTLNKFDTIISYLDTLTKMPDYVFVMDGNHIMNDYVSLNELIINRGKRMDLMGVAHALYPTNQQGLCGRYGDISCLRTLINTASSTPLVWDYDCHGEWTYCNYPLDRRTQSSIYAKPNFGRNNVLGDKFDGQSDDDWEGRITTTSSGIYYDTNSIWGGTGAAVTEMVKTLAGMVKKDIANGISPYINILSSNSPTRYQLHDDVDELSIAQHLGSMITFEERYLNWYYHEYSSHVNTINEAYAYPSAVQAQYYNMYWLFYPHEIQPKIVKRALKE